MQKFWHLIREEMFADNIQTVAYNIPAEQHLNAHFLIIGWMCQPLKVIFVQAFVVP
jgi:hypothetical protein